MNPPSHRTLVFDLLVVDDDKKRHKGERWEKKGGELRSNMVFKNVAVHQSAYGVPSPATPSAPLLTS